jgi:hypothetical protein
VTRHDEGGDEMGMYNDVKAELPCPVCKRTASVDVQFKYGDLGLHHYKIGDSLNWGQRDRGHPGREAVVVSGEAWACPLCGYDGDWPAYVFLLKDVIVGVQPATGEYPFVALQSSFLVLRE